MMASSKISQAHFQRRHGRRTSIPASPTTTDRRPGDKAVRGDLSSPIDTPSKSATGSPLIDWPSPSPAFDVPGFSSPMSAHGSEDSRAGLWDRYNSPDSRHSEDTTKSAAVGALHPDSGVSQAVRQFLPEAGFKSSPLSYTHRNGENNRTPDRAPRFYERAHMATRNISSTSLATEKSLNDEQASGKTPTTKKSRLNLLNPMSLLARRRSSQNSKLEDLNISPLHVPAIPDVDPSIRGKIVHDFSSPRVRTPRRDALPSPAQRRPSDSGGVLPTLSSPVLYSPVFKEHFQDEDISLQPSQTSYLHNQPLEAPSPQSLPAFAQKLPARLPSPEAHTKDSESSDDIPHPELPPPAPPKQTPSPSLDPASAANIPKHTKSTSSRFSFQMAGQDSAAQEKILEDKHRQHFPNQPELSKDMDGANENEFDDFDPDAEDFEEDIPTAGFYDENYDFDDDLPVRNIEVQTSQINGLQHGVGPQQAYDTLEEQPDDDVDLLIQGNKVHSGRPQLRPIDTGSSTEWSKPGQGFHFTPLMNVLSPPITENNSVPTPRDSEGRVIGVVNSQESPTIYQSDLSKAYISSDELPQLFFEGLKISTTESYLPELPNHDHKLDFDDADLYFDDGEFDMEDAGFGGEFDENMLDQESEQIRDIPAENARKYEAALQRSVPGEEVHAIAAGKSMVSRNTAASSFAMVSEGDQNPTRSATTVGPPTISRQDSSGLTEGNLAAYHDALVMAANNAAASGKFNRQVSFSESVRQQEYHEQSNQADLVSDEGHYSLMPGSSGIDEESYGFDDDAMDDELMIAEANAEALENDDDGFYGQEFGFYARAHGKESSDLVNGGFFATRGFNGIKRSHSGKVNFQEPNLTPITERSEWSARNSVVSLQFHGGLPGSAHSLPSPGLNQLIDTPLLEDEMSLSALMRLRRGAFGGSSTSINSLAERNLPNSSPLAHVSTYTFPIQEPGSGRKLSINQSQAGSMSIPESEEEDDDIYDRPTLTQNTPKKKAPELIPRTPYEQMSSGRLSPQPSLGKKSRHSRNSSGAESVSYTQDDIGRWVLERRRTGDDGELEVIGREYLAGARI